MRYNRKTKKRGGFEFTKVYDCPILKSGKKAAKSTCIKEFTVANNFTIIKTVDDGNCFYDTLSKFGEKTNFEPLNKSHLELRRRVVHRLLEDIDEVSPYFVTNNGNILNRNTIEKEIRELGKPNVWNSNGGDIVIQYASTVFGISITIFDVKDNYPHDTINRIVFKPSTNNSSVINVNMLRINDSHFMLLLSDRIIEQRKKIHLKKYKTIKAKPKNSVSNSNISLSKALKNIAIFESSFIPASK
jgi:hypothetical protein